MPICSVRRDAATTPIASGYASKPYTPCPLLSAGGSRSDMCDIGTINDAGFGNGTRTHGGERSCLNDHMKSAVRAILPRAIHPHRIRGGPLRGMQLVTSWHDYPAGILGRTELPLLAWLRQRVRHGETWLDVGAQYGYTAIALARLVGPRGRVVAFEPLVRTASHLTRTARLNRMRHVTVLPLGLGSPETLTIQSLPTTKGMLDSTLSAGDHEHFLEARLDWLWPRIRGGEDRIDGVKIDVQGMEIDVLRGMVDILARLHPTIVVEVHRGVSRAALVDVLASAGYTSRGTPVDPNAGAPHHDYVDDHSYVFTATDAFP